jgi:hypothetical protein
MARVLTVNLIASGPDVFFSKHISLQIETTTGYSISFNTFLDMTISRSPLAMPWYLRCKTLRVPDLI